MLGVGLGISVFSSLSAMNMFGKTSFTKYQTSLMFFLTLALYVMSLVKVFEDEVRILNLILFVIVLPASFAGVQNWLYAVWILILQGITLACFLVVLAYFGKFDLEFVDQGLQVVEAVVCVVCLAVGGFLIMMGYSFVPELLVYPFISHFFKRVNLEHQHYSIERAKSNISFQYTCRGLPTPKHELHNLKQIERECEQIQYKLSKLEKTTTDNKLFQSLSILFALFLLCDGFWVLSLLTGVLVESLVMSQCGLSCGFESSSRISTLINSHDALFESLSGSFYLIVSLLGYYWRFQQSSKDISIDSILGASLVTVMSGFAVHSIHDFLDSESISPVLRVFQLVIHAGMIVCTFCYFIYWHFFKCKNR
jgi:hypothetical protein